MDRFGSKTPKEVIIRVTESGIGYGEIETCKGGVPQATTRLPIYECVALALLSCQADPDIQVQIGSSIVKSFKSSAREHMGPAGYATFLKMIE